MSDAVTRGRRSSVERDVRHSLGDHQHLISFDDDEDAEEFEAWWVLKGETAFAEWKAHNEEPEL